MWVHRCLCGSLSAAEIPRGTIPGLWVLRVVVLTEMLIAHRWGVFLFILTHSGG